MNATHSPQQLYKIRLAGPLTDAAVRGVGGTRRGNVDGETTILVRVRDRAELHSVLLRIEKLGLDLISAMPVPPRAISADLEQESKGRDGEEDRNPRYEPPSEE